MRKWEKETDYRGMKDRVGQSTPLKLWDRIQLHRRQKNSKHA